MPVLLNKFLIEALAVALAASQVFIDKGVRTSFNIEKDKTLVLQILKSGCEIIKERAIYLHPPLGYLVHNLDPAQIIDEMVQTASHDKTDPVLFRDLRLSDLKVAHQMFCSGQAPAQAQLLLEEVIFFYNASLQELPDHEWLKNHELPTYSSIKDQNGELLKVVFRQSRRRSLKLSQLPDHVKYAFLAAEDQNFFNTSVHRGVDQLGLARAALDVIQGGDKGKKERGGSTITQQLVKNLLLTPERTYERKLREVVLAYRLEKMMSKEEILTLYLNYVFFGRQSWGIQLAAESWFKKSPEQLNAAEAAFLAGLPKGPREYNPFVNPEKSRLRTLTVLKQMATSKVSRPAADGEHLVDEPVINESEYKQALRDYDQIKFEPFELPKPEAAYHFFDDLVLNARDELHVDALRENVAFTATVNMAMQKKVEDVFREGLVEYELKHKRVKFVPEGNLEQQVARAKQTEKANSSAAWLVALKAHPAPEDVRWPLAVVLDSGGPKQMAQVGLSDGRVVPLQSKITASLKPYDLVFVKLNEQQAELRFRPRVQGAVVVMENTGRIVSMVGGFSHSLSQWNRAVHTVRGPGSTAKVATYLAALNAQIEPNTLIKDVSMNLQMPGDEVWSPRGASGGIVTMRNGLENSRNLVPVRLLTMINSEPRKSLNSVLEIMKDCGMATKVDPHYPAILGGGVDVRVIDVATCYASVVNGGKRPKPRYIDKIEKDGAVIYQAPLDDLMPLKTVDAESAFQMRRLLQGVVVRGTAKSLNDSLKGLVNNESIEGYIGGKTGTSQEGLDAWFVGFTDKLTIVVWVGYDNENKKTRETLGDEIVAAQVAVPIWREVLKAVVPFYPLERLPDPPSHLRLVKVQTLLSGKTVESGGIGEFHRTNAAGERISTWDKWNSWPEPVTTDSTWSYPAFSYPAYNSYRPQPRFYYYRRGGYW